MKKGVTKRGKDFGAISAEKRTSQGRMRSYEKKNGGVRSGSSLGARGKKKRTLPVAAVQKADFPVPPSTLPSIKRVKRIHSRG